MLLSSPKMIVNVQLDINRYFLFQCASVFIYLCINSAIYVFSRGIIYLLFICYFTFAFPLFFYKLIYSCVSVLVFCMLFCFIMHITGWFSQANLSTALQWTKTVLRKKNNVGLNRVVYWGRSGLYFK